MSASQTFINSLLDAAFRGQTYTGGSITMGLFRTGNVEVSGGGYSREAVSFSTASNKEIETSTETIFTDLPTSQTIVAFKIYDDDVMIDEGVLTQPFTADITNNELQVNYSFKLEA